MKKSTKRFFLFAAVFAAFLSFGALQAAASTSTVYLTGTCGYTGAYEMLDLVNEARKENGVNALTMDQELMEAAMQRAAEISVYSSSTRPSGEKNLTVSSKAAEENKANGFSTANSAMYGVDGWMNQKDTRYRNRILNEDYQSIGIGCFTHEGTTFWVQLFGTEKAKKASKQADAERQMKITLDDTIFSRRLSLYSEDGSILPYYTKSSFTVYVTNPNLAFQAKLDAASFKWSSSDTDKLKVRSTGLVGAVGTGDATLTASCKKGSLSVSKNITVEQNLNTEIKSIENTSSGIAVQWTKAPSAKGYSVYRRKGSGKWHRIAKLTDPSKNSYVDTSVRNRNGTGYTYQVIAFKSKNVYGEGATASIVRLTGTQILGAASAGSHKETIQWQRATGISGYELALSTNKNFTEAATRTKVISSSRRKKQLKGLSSGKYFVRIRTYRRVSGTVYYSAWSSAKKFTVR